MSAFIGAATAAFLLLTTTAPAVHAQTPDSNVDPGRINAARELMAVLKADHENPSISGGVASTEIPKDLAQTSVDSTNAPPMSRGVILSCARVGTRIIARAPRIYKLGRGTSFLAYTASPPSWDENRPQRSAL